MGNLADQLSSDLDAVFFAEDGIGVVTAVYRNSTGGNLTELRGVLDRPYLEIAGEVAGTAVRVPTFTTKEDWLPVQFNVAVGDTLEIQVDAQTVQTYTVRGIEPSGHGITEMALEEI